MGDRILPRTKHGTNRLNRPAFFSYRAHSGARSERSVIVYRIDLRRDGTPLCVAHCRETSIRLTFNARNVHLLRDERSEEHTTELQSLMRSSYAVFCLQKNITS